MSDSFYMAVCFAAFCVVAAVAAVCGEAQAEDGEVIIDLDLAPRTTLQKAGVWVDNSGTCSAFLITVPTPDDVTDLRSYRRGVLVGMSFTDWGEQWQDLPTVNAPLPSTACVDAWLIRWEEIEPMETP